MKITLDIQEQKLDDFLAYINTLDYVSITETDAIPQTQEEEVEQRMQDIQSGQMKVRNWQDAQNDIFKK